VSLIIGAGLSGLIAAHIFPRHQLIDSMPEPRDAHQALLRFRSDAVAKVTGIDFKRVLVRKGIFYQERFCEPNIAIANMYAMKCLGKVLGDRSIWKLDPVERFIAPPDFYWQMIQALKPRIKWGVDYDFREAKKSEEPVISTAPMSIAIKSLGIETEERFIHSGITVRRFLIEDCDVYQTVYFPGSDITLYRASITGNTLICEFIGEPCSDWQRQVFLAFGISPTRWAALSTVSQRYGKIVPIDEQERKALVSRLTAGHNILSLGRFAVWRNLLLDDVVDDAMKVKRLANMSAYDRRLAAANGVKNEK
jgi:hypothetical protein